jgi:hypothetical protein
LKILETKKDSYGKKHEDEKRLRAAAAGAAAGTARRLNIGILEFGQRKRPVFQSRGKSAGRRWFYGKGSWGTDPLRLGIGTWSRPPRLNG